MKIKKVDDKPMVIHTKEKAKIHAHEPKGAKIKGSNIYTVERGPKVHDAKANEMAKKASAKLMLQKSTDGKSTYRKSTIHQSEAKDKGLSKFKRNIRESGTSIKTKNTNLHIAGRTGALAAGAVTEQVEGDGTSGAFGTVLEDLGQQGATSLCTAAATFGLIIGSVMGGPIGRKLILKHDLLKTVIPEDDSILVEDEQKHHRSVSMYAPAAYQLAIAMGIGTFVSWVLSYSGMTFPVYIGSMIVAAFMRNIGEYSGKIHIHMGEINDIGGICLSLFLGIAMITLKLWQLAELALPMIIMLVAQVLLMAMFSYFIVYNVMGRNYDAAVLAAGTCGFGMGATPNAMANMQALTAKFAPSIKAYMLVPIVGSMFADFINSLVITGFINFIN